MSALTVERPGPASKTDCPGRTATSWPLLETERRFTQEDRRAECGPTRSDGGAPSFIEPRSSALLRGLPILVLVPSPYANADDDEHEKAPLLDVSGLAEDTLDGAAEEEAEARDHGCPHRAADRLVHEK